MADMDVFQHAPLGHLNFKDPAAAKQTAPAAQTMSTAQTIQSSTSTAKSGHSESLETLITQNDDLMSRLKVVLRRLSTLESENKLFGEENLSLKATLAQVQDQLAVFKEEKEESVRTLRDEKEHAQIVIQKQQLLIHGFEKEVRNLQLQVHRFQRYHEKVRTQVKPYIQEIKAYGTRLEKQNAELETQVAQKNTLADELKLQLRELIKSSQFEMEEQTKKFEAMVEYFETEMQNREKHYAEQREEMAELDIKVQMLAKIKQSRDILENHMIELEKSKEDLQLAYNRDVNDLRSGNQLLHRENSRLEIEVRDAKSRIAVIGKSEAELQTKNRELTSQIDSLRSLWNEQQIEIERLRKSQEALERLNLELSQKLASQAR